MLRSNIAGFLTTPAIAIWNIEKLNAWSEAEPQAIRPLLASLRHYLLAPDA